MKPEVTETASTGVGYDAGKSEESSTEAQPQADSTGSQGEGDTHDEFGYEKKPAPEGTTAKEGAGDKKPEQAPPAAKEPEASSGYGEEPPVVTPEPKAAEPQVDLGFEVDTKGLPEDELPKLKEFLKSHKMTKEQSDAITQNRREFYAAQEKQKADFAAQQAREVSRIKSEWHSELKNDKVFGGENFARNVKTVEKLVEEFMPGTKKMLTERKTMLPPYVMRDLLRLSEQIHGTGSLTQGNPPSPQDDQHKSDDDLLKEMYK